MLSSKHFYILRLAVGLITLLGLALIQWLPPRVFSIVPNGHITIDAYADNLSGGKSEAHWIDKERRQFRCDVTDHVDFPYCGASIKFFDFPPEQTIITREQNLGYELMAALDLSSYDALKIELAYQGQAPGLRIFLRNAFDMPKEINDHYAQKFIYQNLSRRELKHPITIPLNDFKVADWWLDQYQIERKDSSAAFNHVFEMGIDFSGKPVPGEHLITLSKITAEGRWIQDSAIYIVIISLWLATLIIEGGYRIYRLMIAQHTFNTALTQLRDENSVLRKKAETDRLTGIYNRAGLESLLAPLFPYRGNEQTALLIFDLDHFKAINDTYGHAGGDQVLAAFSQQIQYELRAGDIFGRWGGEEFVLITNTPTTALDDLLNRLIHAVERIELESNQGQLIQITTSIGATHARVTESLEQCFARADRALYQAKSAGRNTWRKS